jgi:peptide/nickel transport system permease protein
MLGASIPSFWFGLILMQIFAVGLGWFPVAGYGNPGVPLSERLHHLVLPSIVLGVVNSALILRFTRASMLDVLGDDHIRTARAKGLSEASVILRHALRNALIPVITVLGLTFALLIGGAIVTETVFGLPASATSSFRRSSAATIRDPGRAAGDRGTLRSHQSGHRPSVPGRRPAREVLSA